MHINFTSKIKVGEKKETSGDKKLVYLFSWPEMPSDLCSTQKSKFNPPFPGDCVVGTIYFC